MNPRYAPLQSWERAALNRYALQNGIQYPSVGAFWHTFGALLQGVNADDNFAHTHFSHAVTRRQCRIAPLATSVKIENRLVSLFAE